MSKNRKKPAPLAGGPELREDVIRTIVAYAGGRGMTQGQLKAVAEGLEPFLQPTIQAAVDKAVAAVYAQDRKAVKDTYKETERRLYALPTLRDSLAHKGEQLIYLQSGDLPEKSNSVVRFQKSGVRMDADDIREALQQNMLADIAADSYEIETVEKALDSIKDDPYYLAVEGKYIQGLPDTDIAEACNCDPSTVRRNRGRLVRKIAIWLYGAAAI